MCDPLTITGLALTAGSSIVNGMAARKVDRARADAMAAERVRQSGFEQQANAINDQSVKRYDDIEGQQQAKTQEIGNYLAEQTAGTPNTEASAPASTSNITVQEEARQRAKASANTARDGQNIARLRSFGDLLGDISIGQARDAQQLGQIGSFRRGSNSVLPYELDATASKGSKLGTLADIMGGVGSIATGAGLSGGSLGGLFTGSPLNATGTATNVAKAGTVVPAVANSAVRLGSLY